MRKRNCSTRDIENAVDTQNGSLADNKSEIVHIVRNGTMENDHEHFLNFKCTSPGIYKKSSDIERKINASNTNVIKNVFISELEPTGRIVKRIEFDDVYMLNNENVKTEIPKVLLKSDKTNEKMDQEVANDNIECDALNRLANDVCKMAVKETVVINRKENEVISINQESKNTTVYKILEPEHFGLELIEDIIEVDVQNDSCNEFDVRQNSTSKPLASTKKHLRKAVKDKKNIRKYSNPLRNNYYPNSSRIVQKTRSGRVVKTNSSKQISLAELKSDKQEFDNLSNVLNNLKDTDYRGPKLLDLSSKNAPIEENVESKSIKSISKDDKPSPIRKRNFPLESICRTCNKIFLGRRLRKHFVQHPDHMKSNAVKKSTPENSNMTESTNSNGDLSIFHFLIEKLQKSNHLSEDQKADLLLTELNDFVEQLHLRSTRLIRNTSGLHFVNNRTARVLGIPEGHYALDLSAFEAPIETVEATNISTDSNPTQLTNGANSAVLNNRSLDYTNLSITIDETLTDEAAQKLNLSAGGKLLPPSEESLLRGVNDLVHTDINKIRPTNSTSVNRDTTKLMTTKPEPIESNTTTVIGNLLPPHLDHVSDNAVEAVSMKETPVVAPTPSTLSLDLSVDFFEFNN